MRQRLLYVVSAGSALMLAAPATWGATARFSVGTNCQVNCGAAGMSQGDLVLGRIEISTDGFSPSGAITRNDLVNFAIAFGPTSTGVFKSEAPAYNFSANWGAAVNAIEDVSFTAVNAPGIAAAGPFLSFGAGGNLASLVGICDDVDCATTSFRGTPATLDPFTLTPEVAAPVPLPPSGPLAAAGALALAAAAWLRRERQPRAA